MWIYFRCGFLMLQLYAEESEGIITHFSADGKPVFLEIQGTREFLLSSITSLVKDEEVRLS
jgi:hypothetical protein